MSVKNKVSLQEGKIVIPKMQSQYGRGWDAQKDAIYYFYRSLSYFGEVALKEYKHEEKGISFLAGNPKGLPSAIVERYAVKFLLKDWTLETAQNWHRDQDWFLWEAEMQVFSPDNKGEELHEEEKVIHIHEAYTLPLSSQPSIDKESGIIKNVAIIREKSKNGYDYNIEGLTKAIPLFEGARVCLDHNIEYTATGIKPLPGPRSYKDLIGKLQNVREATDENGFLLKGDLRILKEGGAKLFEIAEEMPEIIGLSPHTYGFKRKNIVEKIAKVLSVDVVTVPATTYSLFEQEHNDSSDLSNKFSSDTKQNSQEIDMDFKDLTIKNLQEHRNDLVEDIRSDLLEGNLKLQKEVDDYREEKRKNERSLLIETLLREGNIAKKDCSPVFFKQLQEADTDLQVKQLIEDRKGLLAQVEKPKAQEKVELSEGKEITEDLKESVRLAMKGC